MDEWIKKTCVYIQWLTIQPLRKEISPFATTLLNPERIMLSEGRQRKTWSHYMWNPKHQPASRRPTSKMQRTDCWLLGQRQGWGGCGKMGEGAEVQKKKHNYVL